MLHLICLASYDGINGGAGAAAPYPFHHPVHSTTTPDPLRHPSPHSVPVHSTREVPAHANRVDSSMESK